MSTDTSRRGSQEEDPEQGPGEPLLPQPQENDISEKAKPSQSSSLQFLFWTAVNTLCTIAIVSMKE